LLSAQLRRADVDMTVATIAALNQTMDDIAARTNALVERTRISNSTDPGPAP
jgi:hypothetical protein